MGWFPLAVISILAWFGCILRLSLRVRAIHLSIEAYAEAKGFYGNLPILPFLKVDYNKLVKLIRDYKITEVELTLEDLKSCRIKPFFQERFFWEQLF